MNYNSEVYRPPSSAVPAPQDDDTPIGVAFRYLTMGVLGALMVIWAVVGFIFWLPQMVREMFRFSLALVNASLTKDELEPAGDRMREAINFYRHGFEMAYEAILQPRIEPGRPMARAGVSTERLFKEALWAALVWWVLLSILGAVEWTPVAVAQWFMSGAFLEAADAFLVRFWTWLDGLMPASTVPPPAEVPPATPPGTPG